MDLTTKRILIFLAIAFVPTYLAEIIVMPPLYTSTDMNDQVRATLLTAMVMFFPALSVFLTRIITKEGFKNSSCIAPKTGTKSIPYFLMGWFGPTLLTIIGAVVYFLIYPDKFDPDMGYMAGLLAAQGMEASPAILNATAISQFISGILLAPALNFVNCFGEEWGWRGYLLPKMLEKYKMLPTLLISGLIWGIWHAPIIVLGHNYGTNYPGYPYLGIFAMCIFCIVLGICFSYVTIRTGSCLPAVLAHGSVNGFAAIGMLYTDGTVMEPLVGPTPTGIIGGCAFILCAVIMTVLLIRKPQMARKTSETN